MTDSERERAIAKASAEWLASSARGRSDESEMLYLKFVQRVRGRSPEQVRRMERERGLA